MLSFTALLLELWDHVNVSDCVIDTAWFKENRPMYLSAVMGGRPMVKFIRQRPGMVWDQNMCAVCSLFRYVVDSSFQ